MIFYMNNNIQFCSNCDKTGKNEYADAFREGSNGFNFHKGFIHPHEIKDDNTDVCPYCNNKLVDTLITENDFDLIWNVSDSDRQFLEAMIELKKNDPIEYQLKMSQFKANLKQQESSKKVEKDNRPKCPNCHSTNIKAITGTERAMSIMGLGIFSKKINKSFKCLNCKYTW